MSSPRKHHYIPQWQQREFANADNLVNVVFRTKTGSPKGERRNPRSLNYQRDLYSLVGPNGERSSEIETSVYAKLDDQACKMTRELLDRIRNGRPVALHISARKFIWQFFLYNAYRRVPFYVGKQSVQIDQDDVRKKTIEALVNKGAQREEAEARVEALTISDELINNALQWARATQSEDILDEFSHFGVVFGVPEQGCSFVLPDRIVLPSEARITRLNEMSESRMWIPVSPDLAIAPFGETRRDLIVSVSKREARKFNERAYESSETVISNSRELLMSLAKKIDQASVSF